MRRPRALRGDLRHERRRRSAASRESSRRSRRERRFKRIARRGVARAVSPRRDACGAGWHGGPGCSCASRPENSDREACRRMPRERPSKLGARARCALGICRIALAVATRKRDSNAAFHERDRGWREPPVSFSPRDDVHLEPRERGERPPWSLVRPRPGLVRSASRATRPPRLGLGRIPSPFPAPLRGAQAGSSPIQTSQTAWKAIWPCPKAREPRAARPRHAHLAEGRRRPLGRR